MEEVINYLILSLNGDYENPNWCLLKSYFLTVLPFFVTHIMLIMSTSHQDLKINIFANYISLVEFIM